MPFYQTAEILVIKTGFQIQRKMKEIFVLEEYKSLFLQFG